MPIDFDFKRWERVKDTYRRWWSGELDRPVICWTVEDRDPSRPEPALPFHRVTAFYDLSVPAEAIVDRWDYELSRRRFLGDAFPWVWPNFGAGAMATFLGARVQATERTVWFHAPREQPIADIHFEYDPDNVWLNRVKDVCRAAVKRWGGLVQISMTDLGGTLDILSTFRPSDRLLLDLYDHPDHVKRLAWEIHDLWHRCYLEIDEIIRPTNPGYSAWDGAFAVEPYYMLQCDFCYMISPGMFDEFVKPELAATCGRLPQCLYHLDGIGELPHLDSLLEIAPLGGVQWVMGAGQPTGRCWMDVFEKVRRAGKLVWMASWHGGVEMIDAVAERTGGPRGIHYIVCEPNDTPEKVRAAMRKHGVV